MSVAKSNGTIKCPDCGGSDVAKLVPTDVGFAFESKSDSTLGPQNTGASTDYSPDHVIGQASLEQWKIIAERNAQKEEVIQEAGVSREQLRRELDGSYSVMSEREKNARDFAMKIHDGARKQGFGGIK